MNGPPFICTIEDSPAATLLLPYFEVDLGNENGAQTTIRLTHAQARAVKLAALVLDRPQQEILTAGLLGRLEALACSDLSSCSCFKAVLEGLKMPDALEMPLAY